MSGDSALGPSSSSTAAPPTAITIDRALLERVFAEARAAFPAECCGWLTGPRDAGAVDELRSCRNAQLDGDNPSAPNRGAETAYVIAGADLIALSKSLDSQSPAHVIYHSHPNGRAYFSDTDQQVATSPWGDGPAYPVQHLVVGVNEQQVTEAALFAWSAAPLGGSEDAGGSGGGFVEVARFAGE